MSSIGSITPNSLISDKLETITQQLKDLPTVLNYQTLEKLKNNEYEISLKEYTDMNTYRTTMSALYGNSSADKFQSSLNSLFGNQENSVSNVKDFLDKMEEYGISNNSAIKLYTALKSYSTMSSIFQNNSFVSAKI